MLFRESKKGGCEGLETKHIVDSCTERRDCSTLLDDNDAPFHLLSPRLPFRSPRRVLHATKQRDAPRDIIYIYVYHRT